MFKFVLQLLPFSAYSHLPYRDFLEPIGKAKFLKIFFRNLLGDLESRRTCETTHDSCYAVFDGLTDGFFDGNGIETVENVDIDTCKEQRFK